MEEETYQKPSRGAHVLVVSFPLQGHLNPMLQFSKRLASRGLKVTVIVLSCGDAQSNARTAASFDLEFIHISYDFDPKDVKRLRASTSDSMSELIAHYKQNSTGLHPTLKMVIYNSFFPWLLNVAKSFGLEGAPFFTQSCLVSSIYYNIYSGQITNPVEGSSVSLPCVKGLLKNKDDFPTFVTCSRESPDILSLMLDHYSNLEEADSVFFNTVDELENEVLSWMKSKYPVKTIGPAIPSMYLDKRLLDDIDYSMTLFQSETQTCMNWLNEKESGSVVYISMGSLATLAEGQMNEIAMCLYALNRNFLWVVRASEENKLPLDYKEKVLEKGLIVNWCPQLEVLSHQAIGCFVTHCGWNSTLEAISLGVPMVAFPQWSDQPTNAKYISEFWKIGVRVKVNDEPIVTKEEFKRCIKEVIEGDRAQEFKDNAVKLKQLTKGAMQEGGSSDRNIEELVMKLLSIA